MEEIKFKVFNKLDRQIYLLHGYNQELNYVSYAKTKDGNLNYLKTGEFILLRFTTLIDMDGNEIYDGDIIRTSAANDEFVTYSYLYFGGNSREIGWHQAYYRDGKYQYSGCLADGEYIQRRGRVVGNINKNPEILNK